MKRKELLFFLLGSAIFFSCKDQKDDKGNYFPVVSFIKSQVTHVDSSVYPILKLTYIDSNRTDTAYIPREAFREEAKDFLDLPDLSKTAYKKRYTETEQYDEAMDRVMLIYTPVQPEKESVLNQTVLIKPSPEGDKVISFVINQTTESKDTIIQKRLLWNTDKSFQVTTIKQLPDQSEITSNYKVVWNEQPMQ